MPPIPVRPLGKRKQKQRQRRPGTHHGPGTTNRCRCRYRCARSCTRPASGPSGRPRREGLGPPPLPPSSVRRSGTLQSTPSGTGLPGTPPLNPPQPPGLPGLPRPHVPREALSLQSPRPSMSPGQPNVHLATALSPSPCRYEATPGPPCPGLWGTPPPLMSLSPALPVLPPHPASKGDSATSVLCPSVPGTTPSTLARPSPPLIPSCLCPNTCPSCHPT